MNNRVVLLFLFSHHLLKCQVSCIFRFYSIWHIFLPFDGVSELGLQSLACKYEVYLHKIAFVIKQIYVILKYIHQFQCLLDWLLDCIQFIFKYVLQDQHNASIDFLESHVNPDLSLSKVRVLSLAWSLVLIKLNSVCGFIRTTQLRFIRINCDVLYLIFNAPIWLY